MVPEYFVSLRDRSLCGRVTLTLAKGVLILMLILMLLVLVLVVQCIRNIGLALVAHTDSWCWRVRVAAVPAPRHDLDM
jgi:hypothetical protein